VNQSANSFYTGSRLHATLRILVLHSNRISRLIPRLLAANLELLIVKLQ